VKNNVLYSTLLYLFLRFGISCSNDAPRLFHLKENQSLSHFKSVHFISLRHGVWNGLPGKSPVFFAPASRLKTHQATFARFFVDNDLKGLCVEFLPVQSMDAAL
jgi:hypothetical protein